MKKTVLTSLLVLALTYHPAGAQGISDLLDGCYAYNRFWGDVLVARNGKIIFQQCYGFADREKGIRHDTSSLFNLASVAKTMTAAAVFKLHDEGKLSVFDRVDKYIPGFIDDDTDSITILNLLNHTSGLPVHPSHSGGTGQDGLVLSNHEPVTLEQMISQFRNDKLKSRPGSTFEYNNFGYIFLAYIIEKVSGLDYFSYLNTAIFSKAGMNHTHSQLDLPGSEASGHTGIGTGHNPPVKNPVHPSWYTGGAGIYSTTGDLFRFLQALFSSQLFSENSLKLMLDSCVHTHKGNILWTPGWQKNEVDGHEWYSHGGSIEGFSARIGYIPEENTAIVILSNLVRDFHTEGISSVNFSFVDHFAEDIIRILDGGTVACLPVPKGKADHKLSGEYRIDDTHSINISYRNDSLFLNTGTDDGFTLFDYSLNREIMDTSNDYKTCKIFTQALENNNFDGFYGYADDLMRRVIFNPNDIHKITDFWLGVFPRTGKYISSNVCDKNIQPGHVDYSLAFHFEEAEVTMQLSFNDEGLINGFYILRIIPRCHIRSVHLVPTGKHEYFVDGYSYGGYDDFRIKYDKHQRSFRFDAGKTSFQASRTG
jgi:CubicO group peptidase (beta-lactamase class C family)